MNCLHKHAPVAMPDIQNSFRKALAVIFAKFNIYASKESFRQALPSNIIFQLHMQCKRKLRSF